MLQIKSYRNLMEGKEIYTIGHSNRSIDEFISLLREFGIKLLVDIRRYPGSKRLPHFNKDVLEKELGENDIMYHHLEGLGGRRPAKKESRNTAWRHSAFRGYADYMQTDEFKEAIDELERMAEEQLTAYMCSEAVWWSCHRALVSDYLKWKGWKVMHIMGEGKATEHPYTAPAKIVNGKLNYTEDELPFS
jgi:uncharacterized protein (DUF488 family)